MPTVFSKISANTFLLFLIPLIFIIILPMLFGCLGGLEAFRNKTIGTPPKNPTLGNSKRSLNSLIGLKNRVGLAITNKWPRVQRIPAGNIIKSLILVLLLAVFAYLLITVFYLAVLTIIAITYYFSNKFIFCIKFKDNKEIDYWTPIFFPTIGGIFFIFPYLLIFSNFYNSNKSIAPLFILVISIILPPILSTLSFSIVLFKEKASVRIPVAVFLALILLFAFPHLIMNKDFANWYFRWMHYGNIVVEVYPNKKDHLSPSQKMLIFNSGTDLYVDLSSTVTPIQNAPVLILKKKGIFNNIQSKGIIRIPYKDLETIPRF